MPFPDERGHALRFGFIFGRYVFHPSQIGRTGRVYTPIEACLSWNYSLSTICRHKNGYASEGALGRLAEPSARGMETHPAQSRRSAEWRVEAIGIERAIVRCAMRFACSEAAQKQKH